MIVESCDHPSLYRNCHHQIVFARFNLMISYPRSYSREVWHYREPNTDLIRRAISNFNTNYNTNVTKKLSIFNETILNVLSNYILHETVTCDDKDPVKFLNKQNYYARMTKKLLMSAKTVKHIGLY